MSLPPDSEPRPGASEGSSPTEELATIARLERRLVREREARKTAEQLLESKSRALYEANVALQAMTQELEARVAERTAEVQRLLAAERQHEEQLRHVQKMEALGLLAGGVAHDFNNLLTVIGGASQLLQGEPALEPFRAIFDEIVAASSRAGALTQQLLAFSRRRSTEPQRFCATEAIRDLQHLMRRLLTERVDLRLELDERHLLHMDRSGFDQVLLNLAANARDAMPEGGWFLVRTTRVVLTSVEADSLQVAPGEFLRLEAIDCGSGMDADVARRAFDPFFTTKPMGEGSGLGLANVYAIVKQAGGHVAIMSAPGAGTTIQMLFPAAPATAPIRGAMVPQQTRDETTAATVLVVDDEPGVRSVAALSLRKRGFKVFEAGDGEQALAAVRQAEVGIDVLLSDVRMPGMNGFELAMAMRAEHPAMGLVLMSGYVDDDRLRDRIQEAGLPLIEKPFTPAMLAETVRQYIPPRLMSQPEGVDS